MHANREKLETAAAVLACACVVATVVSIAGSQILLGAALVAVFASRMRLRFPPIGVPFSIFVVGTLISLALSGNIWAGRWQVRKLYVFFVLLVVATAVRSVVYVRYAVLWLAAAATASALWSFIQFARKVADAHAAGVPFYTFYVGKRITGFMGHWMTFGGEMSIVLMLLGALLLFAPPRRQWLWWLCMATMSAGLVLAFTRGMWFAATAGGLYLVARWRPKLLFAAPVVAVVAFFAAPQSVRDRIVSVYAPHGDVDSNHHRIVTWRTGLEMIEAHPWFGVGPEEVGIQFRNYVPRDVAPPLPVGWYGHLHNIYLQYAAERGVFVLAAFLWWVGRVLWDALRAIRTADPQRAAILHGCVAALIAILVGGVFEFNLGDSEVLMLFLGVVAFSYVRQPERA